MCGGPLIPVVFFSHPTAHKNSLSSNNIRRAWWLATAPPLRRDRDNDFEDAAPFRYRAHADLVAEQADEAIDHGQAKPQAAARIARQ